MRSVAACNSDHVSAVKKKHKKDSRLIYKPAQAFITSRIGNAGDSEIPAANLHEKELWGGGMWVEKVKKREFHTLSRSRSKSNNYFFICALT